MAKLVSVIALLVIASTAQAEAIEASFTSEPTFELPGYTTYQVTLTTDSGDLTGFDLTLTGHGEVLNQITHDLFPSTIFKDANFLFSFIEADYRQDTQFKFNDDEILLGTSSENTSHISANFALDGGINSPLAAPSINVLQVCMPNGSYASLTGKVTVGLEDVQLPAPFVVPEPASLALLAAGGLAILRRRSTQVLRRRR